MTNKRIVGDNSRFYTFEEGSEIVTGSLTAGNFYRITGLDATTVFPDGLTVGKIFMAKTALVLVSGSDDAVVPITMSPQCGLQDIGSTLSRDAIDTTALCDTVSTFVLGKLTGEISGTMIVETSTGEQTTSDVILGNLIELLEEQTDGSFVASEPGEQVNVAICLTEGIVGATVKDLFLFTPAFITSSGFTGSIGSAKTGDVSISIAKGDFNPQMLKTGRI
jgi:hypothetical protein